MHTDVLAKYMASIVQNFTRPGKVGRNRLHGLCSGSNESKAFLGAVVGPFNDAEAQCTTWPDTIKSRFGMFTGSSQGDGRQAKLSD